MAEAVRAAAGDARTMRPDTGLDPAANLGRLLSPRSIAVVGASNTTGNLGRAVMENLVRFGYPGPVWPVHSTAPAVGTHPAFASMQALPGTADLAILAVGAASLGDAIRQCIAAGTHAGIALAGGFAELGTTGRERQEELKALCTAAGFALCGPNCIGLINAHAPMAATFASSLLASDRLLAGNISIVSQSGGIATFMQALAAQSGFGLRYMVSSGNEAVITVADFIAEFVRDDHTKVICAYIEGITSGDRFVTALAAARDLRKPIVLLKAGATPESSLAAAAHTGAFAGADRVWNAVLREHAVIRVHSLEEMLDTALFLSGHPQSALPRGRGLALVGFGGGGGVLGADQAVANGLTLAHLDDERTLRLRGCTPPIASLANPFDLTPDSYNRPEYLAQFPGALAEIAGDDSVHTVLFQLGAIAHKAPAVMDAIVALRERSDKAIAVAWPLPPQTVLERLPREGIHVFTDPARAMAVLGRVVAHVEECSAPVATDIPQPMVAWPPIAQPGVLAEPECTPLLAAAGLPMADGIVVPARGDVAAACERIGYPVVLKGIATGITHRAAQGLVALAVRSAEDANATVARFAERAMVAGAQFQGTFVQRMAEPGLELIVGAFRDPLFGVMVSCGAGGNLTELLDDVVLARAPLDDAAARRMLERLRVIRHGAGPRIDWDIGAPARFLSRFSHVAATIPWREFALETNPVIWNRGGVIAVDSLAVIATP